MCVPERVSRRRAFTLAELLLVVLLLGLFSGLLVGGVSGLLPVGRQEAAVARARILNAARCSYSLIIPEAESKWTAAADDAAKIALLVEARVLDSSSGSFLSSPGGYVLSLAGDLREPTKLQLKGLAIDYLNP